MNLAAFIFARFCTAGQEKLASTSEHTVIPRYMAKDFASFRLYELHCCLFVSQYFVVRAPSSHELIVVSSVSSPLASVHKSFRLLGNYLLSYGVPVRERYGSTLLPATREQHDQNCTQRH